MRNYVIMIITLLISLTSCKKEVTPIPDKDVLLNPLNWKAAQEIRVNKVEFKSSLVDNPVYNDSVITVQYFYDYQGVLNRIVSNFNFPTGSIESFQVSENAGQLLFTNSTETCSRYNFFGYVLVDNKISVSDNRAKEIKGKINVCTFGFTGEGLEERKVDFLYNTDGLLKSINSFLNIDGVNSGIDPRFGTEISALEYDISNAVKSMKMLFHSIDDVGNPISLFDFNVSVDYQEADEIPDGLRRLVNQSILELSSFGHGEFLFQSFYSTKFSDNYSRDFSDWVCGFGVPKLQTIAAQNVGLVSTKRITGTRAIGSDDITGVPIFQNVDETINFPYIHDATAKTLEIAGLKIYYELVE